MSFSSSARVKFATPVVKSVSRKPSRAEYLHLNLLENHAERCAACEPLLHNKYPSYCRRGRCLERLVLQDLIVKDGFIYSTNRERGYPVRIEVARHYWAVFALLEQVDDQIIRRY
jgi:hypothetical protein